MTSMRLVEEKAPPLRVLQAYGMDKFAGGGFTRTGDIGYIDDDDGYVFIVDLLKDVIKYNGHHVAPAELEDVLNNHPAVMDSCCVRGFDAVAVASKVAGYNRVKEVEFIAEISNLGILGPKSLSGKVLRKELQRLQDEKARQSKTTLHSRL
ncbi:hypothetical protein PF005_g28802 [Phytophthora fragariae]|uniref:AMP-binding enzyme C-terminal domain-containing protein n=3 Tax=Phytophthora TaxID=4783 RepID=A0A6A3PZQ4_9STRA|nr:hypothetical protein PF007_g28693 [Phytophthora fragariae]KAE9167390.1 hypothetical protein PF005_g28802 [Phytophthora fragariae]